MASGTYDFAASEDEYNISVLEGKEITNIIQTNAVTLSSTLEPTTFEISVCLVSEKSDNCDDGIPKYANIELISSFKQQTIVYELSEADFDEFGMTSVEVLPGRLYNPDKYTEASDEKCNRFQHVLHNQEIFVSMFEEDNDQLFIQLNDERLFNGKLTAGADNFSEFNSYCIMNQTINGYRPLPMIW